MSQTLLSQHKVPPKVVVVGSINCDLTTYVAQFPAKNETVLGKKSALTLGGKGLNQAIAAARAGASVSMVACVGDDNFAGLAKSYLGSNGVSYEHVHTISDCTTGTANILVDDNAQNMIAVALGANAKLAPTHIYAAELLIADADILIVQMEVPFDAVLTALQLAKKYNVPSILNPAPASLDVLTLMPLATFLTPNETEMQLLSGIYPDSATTIQQGISQLKNLGAQTLVVTRGALGCSISHDNTLVHLTAFKVDAIDPTGAGDVFNGVFAVALVAAQKKYNDINSEALTYAVTRASAAAALSVTKPLAEGAAPFANDIEGFIACQSVELVTA